jgi:hypothetical protein
VKRAEPGAGLDGGAPGDGGPWAGGPGGDGIGGHGPGGGGLDDGDPGNDGPGGGGAWRDEDVVVMWRTGRSELSWRKVWPRLRLTL